MALFVALFSCENQKKQERFITSLDLVVRKDDSIHVFYKSDGTINFNEKESFWKVIKANNKNQKIDLVFPKKVVPTQIRIDFGKNKHQKQIVVNKIQFNYLGNSFVAKGKEIYKYFRIDQSNTLLNKDTGILIRKDSITSQGPSLYPNGYYLAVKLEELKYKK